QRGRRAVDALRAPGEERRQARCGVDDRLGRAAAPAGGRRGATDEQPHAGEDLPGGGARDDAGRTSTGRDAELIGAAGVLPADAAADPVRARGLAPAPRYREPADRPAGVEHGDFRGEEECESAAAVKHGTGPGGPLLDRCRPDAAAGLRLLVA